MNLNNLMNPYPFNSNYPSTSAGVGGFDYNALSKSLYSTLNSGIYSSELLKKYPQYYHDPMSLYAAQSSLPLPPVSTITSSSSSVSTSTTNNLMSSLLRSPLMPPQNAPPAHSLSSIPTTYNANTIPPSSTSIFSPKNSSSIPASISISSPSVTSSAAAAAANQNKVANAQKAQRLIVKPNAPNMKRPSVNIDQITAAFKASELRKAMSQRAVDPVSLTAKNSAASISILPDDIRPTQVNNGRNLLPKSVDKSKTNLIVSKNNGNGVVSPQTSARTNASLYVRKNPLDAAGKVSNDQQQKTTPKPNLVPRVQVPQKALQKAAVTPQQHNVIVPRQFKPAVQQKRVQFAAQSGAIRPQMNPNNVIRIPSKPSGVVFQKKTSIDPAIQKQLEKNQTSMIEATKPMQISSVVGNSAGNSVSIIAINSNQQQSPVRLSKPPSQNAQIAITPLMTAPGAKRPLPKILKPGSMPVSGAKIVMSPGYSLPAGSKRSADVS